MCQRLSSEIIVQSLSEVAVGDTLLVLDNEARVLEACRAAGIGLTNDHKRRRSLGRYVRVAVKDPLDDTVKTSVPDVGDVWFGLGALSHVFLVESLSEVAVGDVLQVLDNEDQVLEACRAAGIGLTNDDKRRRSLGRYVRIKEKDSSDDTVKTDVPDVGDVWFGLRALAHVHLVESRLPRGAKLLMQARREQEEKAKAILDKARRQVSEKRIQMAEQRARNERRLEAKEEAMRMDRRGLAGAWTKGIINRDCKTLTRPSGEKVDIEVTGDVIKFSECGVAHIGVLAGEEVQFKNGEVWKPVPKEAPPKLNTQAEVKLLLESEGLKTASPTIDATSKSLKYNAWTHEKGVVFQKLQVILCGDSAHDPGEVTLTNEFDKNDSMPQEWAELRSKLDDTSKVKGGIEDKSRLMSIYVDVWSALNYFAYHSAIPFHLSLFHGKKSQPMSPYESFDSVLTRIFKDHSSNNKLIYFSGHGSPGKICFSSSGDEVTLNDIVTAIEEDWDEKRTLTVTVVLDACFSGQFAVDAAKLLVQGESKLCKKMDVMINFRLSSLPNQTSGGWKSKAEESQFTKAWFDCLLEEPKGNGDGTRYLRLHNPSGDISKYFTAANKFGTSASYDCLPVDTTENEIEGEFVDRRLETYFKLRSEGKKPGFDPSPWANQTPCFADFRFGKYDPTFHLSKYQAWYSPEIGVWLDKVFLKRPELRHPSSKGLAELYPSLPLPIKQWKAASLNANAKQEGPPKTFGPDRIAVGDRVCIKERPNSGWGRFRREDAGTVMDISTDHGEDEVTIDFEYHRSWRIRSSEAHKVVRSVCMEAERRERNLRAEQQRREAQQNFETTHRLNATLQLVLEGTEGTEAWKQKQRMEAERRKNEKNIPKLAADLLKLCCPSCCCCE